MPGSITQKQKRRPHPGHMRRIEGRNIILVTRAISLLDLYLHRNTSRIIRKDDNIIKSSAREFSISGIDLKGIPIKPQRR